MYKPFDIDRVVDLPADATAVFDAVSTGTGGWMFPSELAPAVGGTGDDDTKVEAWEPGRLLALRIGSKDGYFNFLDYAIEPRDGGARLRYRHRTAVPADEFDVQLAACQDHTDFYLHTLGEYVGRFAGRPITYVSIDGPETSVETGFDAVRSALGVREVGQRVEVTIEGLGALDATVDYATEHFIGLRTENALYRFFGRDAWGWPVGISAHLFADDASGPAVEKALQGWLDGLYG